MRELTKTIKRKVGSAGSESGEIAVTINSAGISIRPFRARQGKVRSVTWADLIAWLSAKPAANRFKAFEQPLPKAWVPAGGDDVYIDPNKSRYSRGIVISTMPAVPEPYFAVQVAGGGSVVVCRTHLRPAPKRPAMKPAKQQPAAAG